MSIPDKKELLIRLEIGEMEEEVSFKEGSNGFFQKFDIAVDCSFETVNSILSFPEPIGLDKIEIVEFYFRSEGWKKFQESLELYLDDAKELLEKGYVTLYLSYTEIQPMDYKVLYWDNFQIGFDYESIKTCPKTVIDLCSLYDLDDFNKEVFKKCQGSEKK